MKFAIKFLFIIPTLLLTHASASAADNLLFNPGFEEKLEGWDAYLPGAAKNEPLEFGTESEDTHEGTHAARMKSTGPIRWALVSKRSIKGIQPGEKFRVAGWVRFSPSARMEQNLPAAYLSFNFADAEWNTLGKDEPGGAANFIGLRNGVARWDMLNKLQPENLPAKWTMISAVVVSPPKSVYMSVKLNVWGVQGTVYWDDISVERVDVSTQLTEVLK